MKVQIFLIITLLTLTGCVEQQPVVQQTKEVKKKVKKQYTPPPPKKNIELKKVEDENFSSEYMYPETKKKKAKVQKPETSNIAAAPTATITKSECIGMIGQEKFDKYAQMYGGESASLKKCKMLKAL